MSINPEGRPVNLPGHGIPAPNDSLLQKPYTAPEQPAGGDDPFRLNIPIGDDMGMFGPGIGQTYDEYYEEIPDEVKAFFAENDLDSRKFTCKLLEMPEGAEGGRLEYVSSWSQAFPSEEWITKNHGPGTYQLVFSWRGKKQGNLREKTYTQRSTIVISEKNRDIYDEYQQAKYLQKVKKSRQTIRREKFKANMEREIDPLDLGHDRVQPQPPQQTAREYLREVLEMASLMGLNRPQLPQKTIDTEAIVKLATAATPIVLALINKMGNGGMVNMLLEQTQKHTNTLVDMMKIQAGQGSGSAMMKEVRDMVLGSLDIKNALAEEKDSPVDRVMESIMKFAPMLAMFAGMRREQIAGNPMVRHAQNFIAKDENFQAVMADGEKIVDLINGLDSRVGWEQTDAIIAVGGIERPEQCPRSSSRRYPAGDPRNEAEAGQAGTDENPYEQ